MSLNQVFEGAFEVEDDFAAFGGQAAAALPLLAYGDFDGAAAGAAPAGAAAADEGDDDDEVVIVEELPAPPAAPHGGQARGRGGGAGRQRRRRVVVASRIAAQTKAQQLVATTRTARHVWTGDGKVLKRGPTRFAHPRAVALAWPHEANPDHLTVARLGVVTSYPDVAQQQGRQVFDMGLVNSAMHAQLLAARGVPLVAAACRIVGPTAVRVVPPRCVGEPPLSAAEVAAERGIDVEHAFDESAYEVLYDAETGRPCAALLVTGYSYPRHSVVVLLALVRRRGGALVERRAFSMHVNNKYASLALAAVEATAAAAAPEAAAAPAAVVAGGLLPSPEPGLRLVVDAPKQWPGISDTVDLAGRLHPHLAAGGAHSLFDAPDLKVMMGSMDATPAQAFLPAVAAARAGQLSVAYAKPLPDDDPTVAMTPIPDCNVDAGVYPSVTHALPRAFSDATPKAPREAVLGSRLLQVNRLCVLRAAQLGGPVVEAVPPPAAAAEPEEEEEEAPAIPPAAAAAPEAEDAGDDGDDGGNDDDTHLVGGEDDEDDDERTLPEYDDDDDDDDGGDDDGYGGGYGGGGGGGGVRSPPPKRARLEPGSGSSSAAAPAAAGGGAGSQLLQSPLLHTLAEVAAAAAAAAAAGNARSGNARGGM